MALKRTSQRLRSTASRSTLSLRSQLLSQNQWCVPLINDIKVTVGQAVKKGETLVILEAMKMENNIDSDRDGKIQEVKVQKGDTVMEGAILVTIA